MMRWIAAVLVMLALPFGGCFFNETELTGADMSVEIPKDWIVLTRSAEVLEKNSAAFGMTAEEARTFMEDNDFYMVLYEPGTGTELYVTIFGSQYAMRLGSLDALTEEKMALAKEDVLYGYEDWAIDGEVAETELGKFTYLASTMHLGQGEDRMDNRQLFTVYDGLEIYIDLYAGAEGLREEYVQAQNNLAASLQTDYALHRAERSYQLVIGLMVMQLAQILVQCVGLAMSIFIKMRMEVKEN